MRRDETQLDLIPDALIPLKRLGDHVKLAREATFIPIPPGSRPIPCRYCGKMIYLAPHPTTKKPHPVTINFEQGIEPTRTTYGQGTTHKAECPDAINDRSHPHAGMKRRFHK